MKKFIIIFIIGFISMPIIKFYINTPGENDCMIEYLRKWGEKWFLYSFWFWKNHIDIKDLGWKFKIGYSNGCIMHSNNAIVDVFNTQYCYTSKLLLKL